MVVADYSNVVDHEKLQLQTVGINNFCPCLNQALNILSQHKVGKFIGCYFKRKV